MAFTKVTADPANISKLSNRPNQNDGLSAAQLKGRFDKAGVDLTAYLNDVLTEELERTTDGDSGADNIGATAVGGGVATTVQGILEEIDAAAVHVTDHEIIAGIKTFESSPIVPAPTTDTQASTKKYVDDADVLKVNITDIVNDLTTGGTAVPLSAEQGKTLQGEVGALASLATTEKGSLVGAINELDTDKVETSAIVNTLTETEEGKVLDARQGKALNDLVSTMSVILSDLTFNAAWQDGASVDAATNIITLNAHGFLNGNPIEFGAGTGALPAGISAYNVDTKGGEYYYVKLIDVNTFTISLTSGGADVDITSAGTAGWQIRSAFVPILENPISIANTTYKKLEMFVSGSFAGAGATLAPMAYLTVASTDRQIFRNGSQWGNIIDAGLMTSTASGITKYNFVNIKYDFDVIGTDCFITKRENTLHSADKSTGALIQDANAAMIRFTNITGLALYSLPTTTRGYRNGTRIIIRGIN